ncbi:MAG: hypothetical protein IPP40_12740 [bacterium]|nr:hypothetical protein [bacterium]
MKVGYLLVTIVFTALNFLHAEILRVPDDFTSVQTALDSSASGDTVLIGPGEYVQSLNAPMHDVTIASDYIVSGDTTQIMECILRPPPGSVGRNLFASQGIGLLRIQIVGVSFIGSMSGGEIVGGGIAVYGRVLLLDHCSIDSTYGNFGGGLYADSCDVTVSDCRFRSTSAWERGIVGYFQNCDVHMEQTLLSNGFPTAPNPSGENVLMIDGGNILVRRSIIEGFGWDDPPGVTGIRQLGAGTRIVFADCDIRGNRIHNFFRLPEEGLLQFSQIRFDSNRVVENEIQHDLFSYFDADTGSTCLFRNNSFVSNHRLSVEGFVSRMFFTVGANSQFTEVSRNMFVDNESQENSVAAIGSPADSFELKFHNNYIFNNACEGFANPPGGVTMLVSVPAGVVYHNVYSQSVGYAAFQGLHSSPPSFAPYNYWGDSTGPKQEDENPFGPETALRI